MTGMTHQARLLYICLRRRMDFSTGLVGAHTKISYQALAEDLYVEPGQGKHSAGSPTQDAIRWALKSLESAGLIAVQPAERQLIFLLVLADVESVRKKEVHQSYTRATPDQAHHIKNELEQQDMSHAHQSYTRATPEEAHHTSGVRYQVNPNTSLQSVLVDEIAPADGKKKRKAKTEIPPLIAEQLIADGLSREAADELLALRERKRAPLTPMAWDTAKRQIAAAGMALEDGVRMWVGMGWQGVRTDWLIAQRERYGAGARDSPQRPPSKQETRANTIAALTGRDRQQRGGQSHERTVDGEFERVE